jgi:hypothetical protein
VSSIAISAGPATAGRQAAEGLSRSLPSPLGEGSAMRAWTVSPDRRRLAASGSPLLPLGEGSGMRVLRVRWGAFGGLAQIDSATFPTRPARMSKPLRRWLSPSSARKRRPKPINAASVTAI